ncbi:ABC transporter permease subunit [Streptomyces sp. HNM0575]|uniref:ABC transporter permease n=1 Tax=Streptomyces sp. HNM0575 TaxID=2716338 RepID=UPI00145F102B|nr:ABC transporter permease subunit [Streptomyces sp. HNM0575]NLU75583.1 ABC transporter permease subunit [Streptomyces sp. HNM0575]
MNALRPEAAGKASSRRSAEGRSAEGGPAGRRSRSRSRSWSRLRVLVWLLPALLLAALALSGPLLSQHAATDPVAAPYSPPAPGLPLGGDQLGRDVLSRLLVGGRGLLLSSAVVAVAVTGVAAVLGALCALHPRAGAVVERCADMLILLPAVLGIMVVGVCAPGSGRNAVVAAAVVLGTPFAFRVAAAAAEPVARSGFVEAARSAGERSYVVAFRDILPNLRSTLLSLLGLRFVEAVGVVATANFLEVGAQPPTADWALMIRENSAGVLLNPWAVLVPALAIALLAVSVNLALDALAQRGRSRTVTRL